MRSTIRSWVGAALLWSGWIWLALTALVIALSYVQIAMNQGIAEVMELLSPFNIINYLSMVAAFVPGAFLLWLGGKIAQKPVFTTDGKPNI